jgi:hypothetical protein
MNWTPEAVADLKRLWIDEELKCGPIIAYLEEHHGMMGLTRNAVAGKVSRLHLPPHRSSASSERNSRPTPGLAPVIPPSARQSVNGITLSPSAVELPMVVKKAALPAVRVPIFDHFTIMDLKDRSCRWPTNDNTTDMRYCGRSGFPYCRQHRELAWVRPKRF